MHRGPFAACTRRRIPPMAAIDTQPVPPTWRVPDVWAQVVRLTQTWWADHRISARDAVVLLPFAALLAPLREAFAAAGGWQPRVETTLTLAASLAPPPVVSAGLCGAGTVQDRLFASGLLQALPWAQSWAARDPLGFEHLAAKLVQATQQLCAAAAQCAPAARVALWDRARAAMAAATGPAATEASLLRVALEWAALSCQDVAAQTDVLYTLQPSAWVLVRLGGADGVAEAVAAASSAPALRLLLDPEFAAAPNDWVVKPQGAIHAQFSAELSPDLSAVCATAQVQRVWCEDFEAEAQAAAATVITALNEGRAPVALVALDRALVRRVRSLLDRSKVPLVDETGWLLATTRAAGVLMALLRAAQPGAGQDAWLEWIKLAHADAPVAVDALEAQWRGRRVMRQHQAAAQALWQLAQARLQLRQPADRSAGHAVTHAAAHSAAHAAAHAAAHSAARSTANSAASSTAQSLAQDSARPLSDWLVWLRTVLGLAPLGDADSAGAATHPLDALWRQADGAQVLAALRLLPRPGAEGPVWQEAIAAVRFTLAGFTAWVAATLEESPFLPLPDAGAQVVLTPLARAFGRRFGHTVVPGADHKHLGASEASPGLVGDSLARTLGLPDRSARRVQQRLALLHTLRSGPVTLLRRLRDEGEPLAESPDVAWLLLHRAAPPWPPKIWQPEQQMLAVQPVPVPRPSAAGGLPSRLSASQLEALRQCPYRFFARAVLRLDEPEALDAGLAKRDYGTWLHAVLHQFHSQRDHTRPAAPQLQDAAQWATQELGLDDGEMLPYRASFEHFAPAYLAWLVEREMRGWHWSDGESDHRLVLADEESDSDSDSTGGFVDGSAQPPLQLQGRIDRLDHGPEEQSQLLDYKTGNAEALARKVKQPLEDTQLAFYAALLGAGTAAGAGLRAAYLALDGAHAPLEIEHPNVSDSAQQLLQGLRGEWQRLRQSAAMPALGEGAVCDTCEARGLCRRDHWAAADLQRGRP